MRTCKDICRLFPPMARNYRDGRKACRHCGVFIITLQNYCQCCGHPLASKGRANFTQLIRRRKKKTRETFADKKILKDAALIIAKYDLLTEAEKIRSTNAATKKIGDST